MPSAIATPARPRRRRAAVYPRTLPRCARFQGARARTAKPPRIPGATLGAVAIAAAPVFGAPASAQDAVAIASPRGACLDAVRKADRAHGIPAGLLVAVALNESGLHAYALSIDGRTHFPSNREEARRLYWNAMGRSAVMAGCVQVNANAHARREEWPLDPSMAAHWAARHLRELHERTGSWTQTLRRWHGGSSEGTHRLLCRLRGKLQVPSPGANLIEGVACGEGQVARVRRDGYARLELAEEAAR